MGIYARVHPVMKTETQFTTVDVEARRKMKISSGDTIRVWSKIQEKGKTRLQAFEGLVLARKHGTETGASITVRKISNGVGVERIFPLFSPSIDKIEVVKKSRARRSKLYYVRDKAVKEVRRKLKAVRSRPETALVEGQEEAETKE